MKYKHIEYNNRVAHIDPKTGFYGIEYDKRAIEEYKKEIEEKTIQFSSEMKRLKYLVKEGYYYDLFKQYSEEEVSSLLNELMEYKFEFASYMAMTKFYTQYALKSNDNKSYLENYEQHNFIVALFLGNGDKEQAKKMFIAMHEQRLQPSTPVYLNAGRKNRGELVSCFLLSVGDSLNSINYNTSTAMQLSKIGGGTSLDLSRVRARGESIRGVEGVAKGVVPVAKMLEMGFSYANQLG